MEDDEIDIIRAIKENKIELLNAIKDAEIDILKWMVVLHFILALMIIGLYLK